MRQGGLPRRRVRPPIRMLPPQPLAGTSDPASPTGESRPWITSLPLPPCRTSLPPDNRPTERGLRLTPGPALPSRTNHLGGLLPGARRCQIGDLVNVAAPTGLTAHGAGPGREFSITRPPGGLTGHPAPSPVRAAGHDRLRPACPTARYGVVCGRSRQQLEGFTPREADSPVATGRSPHLRQAAAVGRRRPSPGEGFRASSRVPGPARSAQPPAAICPLMCFPICQYRSIRAVLTAAMA